MEESNLSTENMQYDLLALTSLKSAAKWSKFLAILFIIAGAFIGIIGIGYSTFLPALTSSLNNNPFSQLSGGIGIAVSIVYLVIAFVYIMIGAKQMKFAKSTIQGIEMQEAGLLSTGFENLASFFKIQGVIAIIAISFYGFAILIALIGVTMS